MGRTILLWTGLAGLSVGGHSRASTTCGLGLEASGVGQGWVGMVGMCCLSDPLSVIINLELVKAWINW